MTTEGSFIIIIIIQHVSPCCYLTTFGIITAREIKVSPGLKFYISLFWDGFCKGESNVSPPPYKPLGFGIISELLGL